VGNRVGRGGQLLLLDRLPFCPIRDCHKPCGPGRCTCKLCFCADCRARRARARRLFSKPIVIKPYTPPAPVQRALFSQSTNPVRPRRRTP
jgi:hypothetical protein